jgi:hypothetical protein
MLMIKEKTRAVASGYLALVVLPALALLLGWLFFGSASAEKIVPSILYMLCLVAVLICFKGFFMVHPNQAKVLQLFGTYVGSVRQTGLRWANPFYSKVPVSLRVRNCGGGCLEGRGLCGSGVRGRRLRELCADPVRSGPAQHGNELPV